MAVSVKISDEGVYQVEKARINRGWTKTQTEWCEKSGVSISTLKRFLNQQPIKKESFEKICETVGIDDYDPLIDWSNDSDNSRIDQLVGGHYRIEKRLNEDSYGPYLKYLAFYDIENIFSKSSNKAQLESQPKYFIKCLDKQAAEKYYEKCLAGPKNGYTDFDSYFQGEVEKFKQNSFLLYNLTKLNKNQKVDQILQYVDFITDSNANSFYLVREYVEGIFLYDEIWGKEEKKKDWTDEEIIKLLESVLTILKIVHEENIILRSLNPSDLIRRESDQKLCLVDLQDATYREAIEPNDKPASQNPRSSQNAVIFSNHPPTSPNTSADIYMAVEVPYGNPQLSSDIYSLGAICIEAITKEPFNKLKLNRKTGNKKWDEHLINNTKLANVLNKMIEYDWSERNKHYGFVQKVIEDLKECSNVSSSTKLISPMEVGNREQKRSV